MASKFGLSFYETSAKNNINIETIFHEMASILVIRVYFFLIELKFILILNFNYERIKQPKDHR